MAYGTKATFAPSEPNEKRKLAKKSRGFGLDG